MKKVNYYKYLIIFISFALLSNTCEAQDDKENYFYHGQNYGSELIATPFTTIINGGFGILQISNRSNHLHDINYTRGFKNLTYNLSHPFEVISDYGWGEFLKREVLPLGFKRSNSQFIPNYELHLIGGGMTLRRFKEWYRWHNYPHPTSWAYLSWFFYHFINEVVENNTYKGKNIDPVSDMYIFNTLGAVLFSWDKAAKFFGQTLNMRDWSYMPSYDPWQNSVENVGQNFIIKYELSFMRPWSFTYLFGNHGSWGLSYRKKDGDSYTFGAGIVADDLVEIKNRNQSRTQTVTLAWTFGLFYDRENSLLASLILAGTKGYKMRLNIYPGLIWFKRLSPGLFVNLRKDNQVVFGLHLNLFPFGIAKRG